MALTLANMLTRVKRNVPTTTMDTELQDALLEKMNFLVSADAFPFQQKYQYATLPEGDYRIATPDNFSNPISLVIWASDNKERQIVLLDLTEFTDIFPKPDERTSEVPTYACFRVAESEIWFNCPSDGSYTLRLDFYAIPDDATDTTISQLTELAKLTLVNWASSEGLRMMQEHDRADAFEAQGDKHFLAMKKRYQLALEQGARIVAPQWVHALKRN